MTNFSPTASNAPAHVVGPPYNSDDLQYDSINALVNACAARLDDKPFASTAMPNGWFAALSYRDVDQRSAEFARYLREVLKLSRGDVVAIQAPNCVSYVVTMLGVLRSGLILSNINPQYTPPETQRQLKDSGAKALVLIDVFGDKAQASIDGTNIQKIVKLSLTDFFTPVRAAVLGFMLKRVKRLVPAMTAPHVPLKAALDAGAAAGGDVDAYTKDATPDDTVLYQYSGGTTGVSKGVELTTRNILVNIAQAATMSPDLLGRTNQHCLLVMPLYHMMGLFITLSGFVNASQIALAPSPRPLSNLKKPFETFKPDVFPGVNTLFVSLMREPWFMEKPPRLHLTLTGAMQLQEEVALEWSRITGSKIINSYGMTETTTVLTSNLPEAKTKLAAVGKPLPGAEVRIESEDGGTAPVGTPGEVLARGPQVMKGYLNNPAANDDIFVDGWMRTGDIGYVDEDGNLFLVDRKKDMILVGGFNVFPNEIEETLAEHPDITEAGVIGAPNENGEETVAAYIVRSNDSLTEEDVKSFCAERLTNYKRPKIIHFVNDLPKSPVGKVLRKDLRTLAGTTDTSQ